MLVLIYTGGDQYALAGVPMRDLTDQDIKEYGLDVEALIASKLYARPEEIKAKPKRELPSKDDLRPTALVEKRKEGE